MISFENIGSAASSIELAIRDNPQSPCILKTGISYTFSISFVPHISVNEVYLSVACLPAPGVILQGSTIPSALEAGYAFKADWTWDIPADFDTSPTDLVFIITDAGNTFVHIKTEILIT